LSSIAISSSVPTSTGVSVTPVTPRPHLPTALQRACLAAKTAADNKGQDVVVLDLRPLTPLFDFFVLSTGPSRRVVHTIVEETDATMRSVGDTRAGVEGYDASKWVVQDYGDVVVHVFDPDTREYYKLEELWADAKKLDWEQEME
jgi:ribosome-associated protein